MVRDLRSKWGVSVDIVVVTAVREAHPYPPQFHDSWPLRPDKNYFDEFVASIDKSKVISSTR